MDSKQFDALSKVFADGMSRRQAMARFGAGGVLAGIAAAMGWNRAVAVPRAAQDDTCRLEIVANVRLGPSAGALLQGNVPGELRGELSFALGADGAIDSGRVVLDDDTEFPVVGQATGRAINLRIEVGDDRAVILVGTAERSLIECTGAVDGLLTGPQPGDLGDWHATATSLGGGDTGGATGTTATQTPRAIPPATASGGAATATAAATSTASATETATATAEATEAPTVEPTAEVTPISCTLGTTPCNGVCVDTLNDRNNCGECGNVCPSEELCLAGVCFEPLIACVVPLVPCNNICVDLAIDQFNCGACGNTCRIFETCQAGECTGPAADPGPPVLDPGVSCTGGQILCDGVCVDIFNDPSNCGFCGNVCTGILGVCNGGNCL